MANIKRRSDVGSLFRSPDLPDYDHEPYSWEVAKFFKRPTPNAARLAGATLEAGRKVRHG